MTTTMVDPSRHRWYQLHLATVIALTLTAGGLLWMNTRPITFRIYLGSGPPERVGFYYGWPEYAVLQYDMAPIYGLKGSEYYWKGFAFNSAIALLILVGQVFVC